jgi:hypothetical protein
MIRWLQGQRIPYCRACCEAAHQRECKDAVPALKEEKNR